VIDWAADDISTCGATMRASPNCAATYASAAIPAL
jgi:hypothetical protein